MNIKFTVIIQNAYICIRPIRVFTNSLHTQRKELLNFFFLDEFFFCLQRFISFLIQKFAVLSSILLLNHFLNLPQGEYEFIKCSCENRKQNGTKRYGTVSGTEQNVQLNSQMKIKPNRIGKFDELFNNFRCLFKTIPSLSNLKLASKILRVRCQFQVVIVRYVSNGVCADNNKFRKESRKKKTSSSIKQTSNDAKALQVIECS